MITMYGSQKECGELEIRLRSLENASGQKRTFRSWNHYDAFIHHYIMDSPEALFVLADGGEGLEVMNAALNLAPKIPSVWFASDNQLGPQAMRLDAVLLHPIQLRRKLWNRRWNIAGNLTWFKPHLISC